MVFNTFGGDKRDRTADLLNAIQALSQLSYTPKFSRAVRQLLYYSTWAEFVKGYFLLFWSLQQKQAQKIPVGKGRGRIGAVQKGLGIVDGIFNLLGIQLGGGC